MGGVNGGSSFLGIVVAEFFGRFLVKRFSSRILAAFFGHIFQLSSEISERSEVYKSAQMRISSSVFYFGKV